MFGRAGHAYIYFIYGMYEMFNIVAWRTGEAHAVLVRAAEPLDGWEANLSGPGRLATAFKLKLSNNGLDLTGKKLFLLDNPDDRPAIGVSPRIGIDYAKDWVHAPLRFFDVNSKAVSGSRSRAAQQKLRELSAQTALIQPGSNDVSLRFSACPARYGLLRSIEL